MTAKKTTKKLRQGKKMSSVKPLTSLNSISITKTTDAASAH
jgi:hypothetical protein